MLANPGLGFRSQLDLFNSSRQSSWIYPFQNPKAEFVATHTSSNRELVVHCCVLPPDPMKAQTSPVFIHHCIADIFPSFTQEIPLEYLPSSRHCPSDRQSPCPNGAYILLREIGENIHIHINNTRIYTPPHTHIQQ